MVLVKMPPCLSVNIKTEIYIHPGSTAFGNTTLGSYVPGRVKGIQLYINVLSSAIGISFCFVLTQVFCFQGGGHPHFYAEIAGV